MPTMLRSMKLRKTPGGEDTRREAPKGHPVTVNGQDQVNADLYFNIQVDDVDGQPKGWVKADSVNQSDSVVPIDRKLFAAECWRSAIDFGANAHYLVAVATLRSNIADGVVGDEAGPFRLLPTEWVAKEWGAAELLLRLDPELLFDWRMQCAAFALMAFRTAAQLQTKLGRGPTATELFLAQLAGSGIAAQAQKSDESILTLLTRQSDADFPPGQSHEKIVDRFAKWFKENGQPVTGKQAFDTISAGLQMALDQTKSMVEATGAVVIADVFAGVEPTAPSSSNLNLTSLSAEKKAMAEKILAAFAKAGFGGVQQTAAVANAMAESGLQADSESDPPEQSIGLFQLNMKNGLGVGRTKESLKDPDTNIGIIIDAAKHLQAFQAAISLREAVDVFVRRIERPANQTVEVDKRLKIAETFEATKTLLA
ncbi:MAG TPA: phage tail tip lysozyme [Rhodopila sp.]